jgi:hypothetical protein
MEDTMNAQVDETVVDAPKKDRGKRKYESKKLGYRVIRKNTGHVRAVVYNLKKWCDENGFANGRYMRLYLTLKGGKDVDGYVLERVDSIPVGTVDEVLETLEPVVNAPDAPVNEEDTHAE